MIKLDIDSDEGIYETLRRVKFANYISPDQKPFTFKNLFRTYKGWHGYIECNVFSPIALLAWQAMLGSDPYRELMNSNRLNHGVKKWNIMFTSREDQTENYAELFNFYLTMKIIGESSNTNHNYAKFFDLKVL